MNRPEGISESAWEAAKPKAIEFVDWLGRFTVDADAEHVLTTTIALAIQSSVEAERARLEALLRDPAAVRVNYLRGGIACQHLIDEAVGAENERCARLCEDYEPPAYTDVDNACVDLAAAIRKGA